MHIIYNNAPSSRILFSLLSSRFSYAYMLDDVSVQWVCKCSPVLTRKKVAICIIIGTCYSYNRIDGKLETKKIFQMNYR